MDLNKFYNPFYNFFWSVWSSQKPMESSAMKKSLLNLNHDLILRKSIIKIYVFFNLYFGVIIYLTHALSGRWVGRMFIQIWIWMMGCIETDLLKKNHKITKTYNKNEKRNRHIKSPDSSSFICHWHELGRRVGRQRSI